MPAHQRPATLPHRDLAGFIDSFIRRHAPNGEGTVWGWLGNTLGPPPYTRGEEVPEPHRHRPLAVRGMPANERVDETGQVTVRQGRWSLVRGHDQRLRSPPGRCVSRNGLQYAQQKSSRGPAPTAEPRALRGATRGVHRSDRSGASSARLHGDRDRLALQGSRGDAGPGRAAGCARVRRRATSGGPDGEPVSYTHLTLPTI